MNPNYLAIICLLLAIRLSGQSLYAPQTDPLLLAADSCFQSGKWDEALLFSEKAMEERIRKGGWENPDLAVCHHYLGMIYFEKGLFSKALRYHKLTQEGYAANPQTPSRDVAQNYFQLGLTYTRLGVYDRALHYLEKSLALQQGLLGREQHREFTQIYASLGDLMTARGYLNKALDYYQYALINAFAGFQNKSPDSNPDLESHTLLLAEPDLIHLLEAKARLLQKRFERKGDPDDLKVALKTWLVCDQALDRMRLQAEDTLVRTFLSAHAPQVYESALETAFTLHDQSGDANILEQVFWLIERSRILENPGASHQVPAEWLEREKNLQTEIGSLKNQLALQEEPEPGLSARMDELLREYQQLVRMFESEYPAYYQEKYLIGVAPFGKVRSALSREKRGLVEYFAGKNALFTLVLAGSESFFIRIPLDFPLSAWATALDSASLSYRLYDKIWRPLPGDLPRRLVVTGSGVLDHLPFEALLSGPENQHPLPYLIREHQFSYAYSASRWMNESDRGLSKDEALHEAKIRYLEEHPEAPPHEWTGLTDLDQPEPTPPGSKTIWWATGISGLILIRIWWKRQTRRRMLKKIGR